jgi:putative glutamine amidotransferase
MSALVKIAVSQRVDLWAERGERRDALDQRLCQWLAAAGCVPLPVPNLLGSSSDGLRIWLREMMPEAILLSGGNDIGEVPERDDTERQLLDYAKDGGRPALGGWRTGPGRRPCAHAPPFAGGGGPRPVAR